MAETKQSDASFIESLPRILHKAIDKVIHDENKDTERINGLLEICEDIQIGLHKTTRHQNTLTQINKLYIELLEYSQKVDPDQAKDKFLALIGSYNGIISTDHVTLYLMQKYSLSHIQNSAAIILTSEEETELREQEQKLESQRKNKSLPAINTELRGVRALFSSDPDILRITKLLGISLSRTT